MAQKSYSAIVSFLAAAIACAFPATATDVCGAVCNETWNAAGNPWVVTCDVTVASGCTLDIEAGVTVRFQPATGLVVDGELNANGTAGSLATFTSDSATPAAGDWRAVEIGSGGSAVLNFAEIAFATDGVSGVGASLTIQDSTIRDCADVGVRAAGGTLALTRSTVQDNAEDGVRLSGGVAFALDDLDATGSIHGVYAEDGADGTIAALTATGNTHGLYAYRSVGAATTVGVTGSSFTGNEFGVYIQGQNNVAFTNPAVTVNASSLFGNVTYDLYASGFANADTEAVEANGNWWGGTEASTIGGQIFDRKQSLSSPAVDWCNYLDGPPPTGAPAHGKICPNLIVCGTDELWDRTDAPYLLTSTISVCAGNALDVGAGVETRGVGLSGFRVNGTLRLLGTPASPVRMVGDDPVASRGDWDGLTFLAGSVGEIDRAEIAWATHGIEATDATLTVHHGTFRECQQRGIWQKGGSLLLRDGDFRDNTSYGLYFSDDADIDIARLNLASQSTGIHVTTGASGTIVDLEATDHQFGVFVDRGTTSETTLTIAQSGFRDNLNGIYIRGLNSASAFNPQVTVTTSSFENNSQFALYTTSFFDPTNSFVRAPDNWWGSNSASVVQQAIFDQQDNAGSPHVLVRPFGFNCEEAIGRDTDLDGFGDFDDLCPAVPNLEAADQDGDGMGDACDPDPGAAPTGTCDGNADVVDGYADSDGDGWGDPCDFHPMRADSYPGAPEICDGRDNDGDQIFADGELTDLDLDGAVDCQDGMGDCDDTDPLAYPCNCELCDNLIDDDCNGLTDALDPSCTISDYCIQIVGTSPLELAVDRGACTGANAAAAIDLIRGSTTGLGFSGGSVDLGDVSCVADGLTLDRATDSAQEANPVCNETNVFWLARPAGTGDFGVGSGGEPRDVTNPDPVCP